MQQSAIQCNIYVGYTIDPPLDKHFPNVADISPILPECRVHARVI